MPAQAPPPDPWWYRLRLRVGPVLAVVAILLIVWVILVGTRLFGARSDLVEAEQHLDAVRNDFAIEALLRGEATEDLEAALELVESADGKVSGPLMWPAKRVPFFGRQLQSVDALASAANTLLDTTLRASDEANVLLDDVEIGTVDRARLLRRLEVIFDEARVDLAGIDLGPRQGLLDQLRETRNEFAEGLADAEEQLERGAIIAGGLANVLEGPRQYLLGAANNAEMRAGQGLVLSAGRLLADDGEVLITSMRPVWEREVEQPVDIRDTDHFDRWGWITNGQDWLLNFMSPRFPATAELTADMWEAAGERPVDGVLVLDPFALQAVLSVVGPVDAGAITVSAENVLDLLLHEQYLDVDIDPFSQFARRERLSEVAPAVFTALIERNVDVVDLFQALADAARGRHVLAWSRDPVEQQLWNALDVSGSLTSESLLVSVLNRGPNKLDYFMYVDSTIDIASSAGQNVVTVTVTVTNRTPPGLPQYVAGPNLDSPTPADWYRGIVTVNLPGAARAAHIRGVTDLTVVGADGPTRVVGTEVLVAPGDTAVVEVVFALDDDDRDLTIEPMARFPIGTWNTPDGRVTHGLRHTVTW